MSQLTLLDGSTQVEDLTLSAQNGVLSVENLGYPGQPILLPLQPVERGTLVLVSPLPRMTVDGLVQMGNVRIKAAEQIDIVTITFYDMPIYGKVTWHVSRIELNRALQEKAPRYFQPLLSDRQVDEGFE